MFTVWYKKSSNIIQADFSSMACRFLGGLSLACQLGGPPSILGQYMAVLPWMKW